MNSVLLVQAAELAGEPAGDEPPTLLDVRWSLTGPPGREEYLAGHLPGAVFVDLDTALAAPLAGGGRHPLPSAADFGAAMRAAGVTGEKLVVVYDAGDGIAAARAWWCLSYFGHRDVRVLDGGYRAWTTAGLPVSVEVPEPPVGDFEATPGALEVLDADAAADLARTGVLLDVRAAQRYRGETEPVDPVAGHIPGAFNAPTTGNVTDTGRFVEPAALRDRFASLGAEPNGRVGAYCGSGVSAAHTVLALRLAGIPAALYVGSWSDWVSDRSRPVAGGADPG